LVGGFVLRESREIAKLHQLRSARVDFGQAIQRLVHLQQFVVRHRRLNINVIKVHLFEVAAVFYALPAARILDQDTPHVLRDGGKEMPLAVPFIAAAKPHIRFVHKGSGLQRLPGRLARQFPRCQLPQIAVDSRQ
jgi:hypothetical protein